MNLDSIPTISKVVSAVKNTLESQFSHITTIGELTNFAPSGAGHYYFTLSDPDASLSGVCFRGDAMRNPAIKKLKDGDKVVVTGSLGVYAKRGTFQIIVKRIVPVGKGGLKEIFEDRKKKLMAEGLFDMEQKQKIPLMPKKVGVITSPGGAALQDFLNIFDRRSLWMSIMVIPAVVQGEGSPNSLREALFKAIKYSLNAPEEEKLDCLVITRGGGSLEDLWSFNDEALAWDIYNCPIPVVSAVGHEVDFSISDFVADFRCETPSAAAELLTQEQSKIKNKMAQLQKGLIENMRGKMNQSKLSLSRTSPHKMAHTIRGQVFSQKERLAKLNLMDKVHRYFPVQEWKLRLDDAASRMQSQHSNQVFQKRAHLEKLKEVLDALNPQKVLGRGYTYLIDDDSQELIGKAEQFEALGEGRKINVHFSDGTGKVIKN